LILQRSGIGDPSKLRKAGVKPLVDLPGVGLNFQDHYLTFSTYRATPDTESFDDFVRGDPEVQKRVFEEWSMRGTVSILAEFWTTLTWLGSSLDQRYRGWC